MANEISEAIQIVRVAYDGIEIAMKIGSDGIEAMQKVLGAIKGMLDYEKNLGRTSMKKLLMRGGDLQVLEFDNSEIKKVKRLAKKYGILYSMMPNVKDGQTEIIFHTEAIPRINVMLQKLKTGKVATFDDFVKSNDDKGNNKLLDFFQRQKRGTEKVESKEGELVGDIMQGLIEKVGVYAVEQKNVSVDSVKDKFNLEDDAAKEVINKLVIMGALERTDIEDSYNAILDKEMFIKRINSYQSIAERIQAVSMSKNYDLSDITISKTLIKDESEIAVKTRVPGTWGQNVRYIWINRDNIIDIHDGKTMLTFLDKKKDYKLYDESNRVVGVIKGEELYSKHYDSVEASVRKRYETREKVKRQMAKERVTKVAEESKRGGR